MADGHTPKDRAAFNRRIKEARIGDPAAQYEVALMYANGRGTAKDVKQAFHWAEAAGRKGNIGAQYLLGSAYEGGIGVDKDERKALTWLLTAVERGSDKSALRLAKLLATHQTTLSFQFALQAAGAGLSEAQYSVAQAYESGLGVARDMPAAMEWFAAAAKQGLALAQFSLAGIQERGCTGAIDLESAIDWYEAAAKQGCPAAQVALERLADIDPTARSSDRARFRTQGASEARSLGEQLLAYVKKGGDDDFYNLGLLYLSGKSLERSAKLAKHWLQRAAEMGHADAQFELGKALQGSDPVLALAWLERSADQGCCAALGLLGQMQVEGVAVPQNFESALSLLARASHQGHAPADHTLNQLLKAHVDGLQLAFLRRSAQGGHPQAQFELAGRYECGRGVLQDWRNACHWYLLAAENEHVEAQCALASCFANGFGVRRDLSHAFHWYERASNNGSSKAKWNLGEMYATGFDNLAADAKKAAVMCKQAAAAGFPPAQATMGMLFSKAKNHERAVYWWRLAADQGDLEALFNLAHAYRTGLGVAQDVTQSFTCLIAAAEAGLAAAQARLGLAYATGDGIILDFIEAAKWFMVAAVHGDAGATVNRDRARSALSPAQWSEANRRAQQSLVGFGKKH